MPYVALEKLHNLYDGYRKVCRVAGRELLLLQEQGRTKLIANACPHMGAPLTNATYADDCLRCPMHGIAFNVNTGKATATSGCSASLQFFSLVYEGNTLGVDVRE